MAAVQTIKLELRQVGRFAALAIIMTVLFAGCGKKDEAAPPPPPAPAPIEEVEDEGTAPVEPTAPTDEEPAPSAAASPVTDVLGFAPENSSLTAGIPSFQHVYDQALALARKFSPPDTDVDAIEAEVLNSAKQELGDTEAQSFADIFRNQGFDPDAPIGLYIDLAAATDFAQQMQAANLANMEPFEELTEEAAPDAEGEAVEETEPDAMEAPAGPSGPPPMAVVVPLLDAEKAEQFLLKTLEDAKLDISSKTISEIKGVTVNSFPEFINYFVTDEWLALGTDPVMLGGIAAGIASPSEVRYGAEDYPVSADPEDIVLLTRTDWIAGKIDDFMATIQQADPTAAAMAESQMEMLNKMIAAFDVADPIITTLNVSEDKIALVAHTDYGTHPDLAALNGEPGKLAQFNLLPESTVLAWSNPMTDVGKTRIIESLTANIPPEMQQDQQMSQVVGALGLLTNTLGDEITIAVTGAEGLIPQMIVVLGVSDEKNAKNLLMTAGIDASTPAETYNEVGIIQMPLPVGEEPAFMYFGFVNNMLIASNGLDDLKSAIDLAKSGGDGGFTGKLDPALESTDGYFSALVAMGGLVPDVIIPVMAAANPSAMQDEMVAGSIELFEENVREVRWTNGMNGDWQEVALTVYLQ